MAGAKIGALHVSLGLDSAQFTNGLKLAQGDMSRFGKIATAGFAAIAAGALGAAAALGIAVRRQVDYADSLSKSAQKAGVATEALSRLEYAGRFADVSLETLTGSLGKLSKSMSDAVITKTSTAATAFRALGIEVTNTDGSLRQSDVVLSEIAERFARLENGTTKTSLAMMLFGKSGAALIPLLNEGASGLKRYADESDRVGNTISTSAGRAAEKFNDTLEKVRATTDGITKRIMVAALPAMQEFADALANPKFAAAAETLATNVVGSLAKIIEEIGKVRGRWDDMVNFIHHGVLTDVIKPKGSTNIEDRTKPGDLANRRLEGAAGMLMLNSTFGALGDTKSFGSTEEMWASLKPPTIDLSQYTGEVKKAQEVIDPFAARIVEMSDVLTQTADPFAQMQMDVTDLTTMFEHGRIGAEQFGTAITKTVAGAAGDLAGLAGSALDSLSQIFEGNKALAVASAIVNGIESVTKTFATYGATPWGFAAAGVAGLTAAANVANILRTTESSKSMPSTAGAGSGAAGEAGSQGQSIYFTFKGSGAVNIEDIMDQMTKQIADGGHQGFIKVMQAA